MGLIHGLPPELLLNIAERLDLFSQKQLRCVDCTFSAVATPLVFETVTFNLDKDGTLGLVSISQHDHLRRHVHKLVLQRRQTLMRFDDFESWAESNIHEFVPFGSESNDFETQSRLVTNEDSPDDSMPREQWFALPFESRIRLFEEYLSDQATLENHVRELITSIRYRSPYSARTGSLLHSRGEEEEPLSEDLDRFERAIQHLKNVVDFKHIPSEDIAEWGTRWRCLRFHPDAIEQYADFDDDYASEALQLSLALRALGLSGMSGRSGGSLKSMELCTTGPSFLNPKNLVGLWDPDFFSYFGELDILDWIDSRGGEPAAFSEIESLSRELMIMERSMSSLRVLNWEVEDDPFQFKAVSRSIVPFLKQGNNLDKLRFTLRRSKHLEPPNRQLYTGHLWTSQFSSSNDLDLLGIASYELFDGLAADHCLTKLRSLEMSIATREQHLLPFLLRLPLLRELALKYVALLPDGGTWESLLSNICKGIQLETVRLFALEDTKNRGGRVILRPLAKIWAENDADSVSYKDYETAVTDFVLRKSPVLCPLDPHDFILSHQNSSSHSVEKSS